MAIPPARSPWPALRLLVRITGFRMVLTALLDRVLSFQARQRPLDAACSSGLCSVVPFGSFALGLVRWRRVPRGSTAEQDRHRAFQAGERVHHRQIALTRNSSTHTRPMAVSTPSAAQATQTVSRVGVIAAKKTNPRTSHLSLLDAMVVLCHDCLG